MGNLITIPVSAIVDVTISVGDSHDPNLIKIELPPALKGTVLLPRDLFSRETLVKLYGSDIAAGFGTAKEK